MKVLQKENNGVLEAYRRWRHTRGYGVHSPFAYDMVKEVVRPERGYAFYGYEEIDNYLYNGKSDTRLPHVRRHARMLLRLASWLDIRTAYMPNDEPATPYYSALRSARSDMRITSAMADIDRCRLVASSGGFVSLELLQRLVAQPGRVLVLREPPEGWPRAIFEALPSGLMLYSRDAVIVVHRERMQKVAYSIKL